MLTLGLHFERSRENAQAFSIDSHREAPPPHAARAFLNTAELNKRGAVALLSAARRECRSILKRDGSILRRADRAPPDRQP